MWQTGKPNTLDVMTLDKVNRAGEILATVDGQRVWANSPVLVDRILQEEYRMSWNQSRGITTRRESPWGDIFHDALRTQVGESELDCSQRNLSTRPRRSYYSEEEIYYMDHSGNSWDKMSGKQLNSEEVVAARLDEIKHLHSYDVCEKVPIQQC